MPYTYNDDALINETQRLEDLKALQHPPNNLFTSWGL